MQAHEMNSPASVSEAYDLIAQGYDGLFNGALAFAENQAVFRRLVDRQHFSGHVLDVGCGTGLVLDWCAEWLKPSCYRGFDVSLGMIKEAQRKHARYTFNWHDANQGIPFPSQYDSIVSLFAVSSYLSDLPAFLASAARALTPGGKLALMPFGPGERYVQDYKVQDGLGREVPHRNWTERELALTLEESGFEAITIEGFTSAGFHDKTRAVRSALCFESVAREYRQDVRRLSLDTSEALFLLASATKAG